MSAQVIIAIIVELVKKVGARVWDVRVVANTEVPTGTICKAVDDFWFIIQ